MEILFSLHGPDPLSRPGSDPRNDRNPRSRGVPPILPGRIHRRRPAGIHVDAPTGRNRARTVTLPAYAPAATSRRIPSRVAARSPHAAARLCQSAAAARPRCRSQVHGDEALAQHALLLLPRACRLGHRLTG
jgi:hypothetical protein